MFIYLFIFLQTNQSETHGWIRHFTRWTEKTGPPPRAKRRNRRREREMGRQRVTRINLAWIRFESRNWQRTRIIELPMYQYCTLWMRSIKITICSMDRFAYKLKGTSFDCIATFRGSNRFPRLRLARGALLFRPTKSPRFPDCYVEQNQTRRIGLNDGDETERERIRQSHLKFRGKKRKRKER